MPAVLDAGDPSLMDLGNPGQRADIISVSVGHVNELSNAFRVLSGRNQDEFDTSRERFVPLG
jgi:hypothetical protein